MNWGYTRVSVPSSRAAGPQHLASATPWHRRRNPALHLSRVFRSVMGQGCGKLLEIEEGMLRNQGQGDKMSRWRHMNSYRGIYEPKVALLCFDTSSASGTKHHQKWSANRSRWLNLDMRAMDTNRTEASLQRRPANTMNYNLLWTSLKHSNGRWWKWCEHW